MDIDSPQTPDFTGLKDFPMGLLKVSGPPKVKFYPAKEELPFIPEKEEYRDSGVSLSSVDSTPEPREADANFVDIGSDSTEGSESVNVDEGKEVLCSPDFDFEIDRDSTCRLQSFLNPLKSEKMSLDDLSAGPPILDLTRLMMQPLRSSLSPPKPQKRTVLPDSLLNKVTDVIRDKLEAGEDINSCDNQTTDTHTGSNGDGIEFVKEEHCLLDIDIAKNEMHESKRKVKTRAKKRKSGSSGEIKSPKKEKKATPNYFVAVQIRNQEVHTHISRVQDHLKATCPCLSAAFVPVPTLHFTLHVSHLYDDDDIVKAKAALDTCRQKVHTSLSGRQSPLLHIVGLGTFRGNVLFAKLVEDSSLHVLNELADTVHQCFLENNIASTDERGFKPHLTIMKLSKAPQLRHKGMKKLDCSLYEPFSECEFGWQRVLGLQLCSMHKPKDQSGYYHVEHEVTFDLPDGEPRDGSGGRSANFTPKPPLVTPIKAVVHVQRELKWVFKSPQEEINKK